MRNRIRAVRRPKSGEVAACGFHLSQAMEKVTSPTNGDDNDTHIVVRRLGSLHEVDCQGESFMRSHRAQWVLIPQAVLR